MAPTFADRTDAGAKLATLLDERNSQADLVLAIPRGGLPVGRPVADALDIPLDIIVARKIGSPSNPELALGAVASNGSVWWNHELINFLSVSESYLENEREREERNAAEKANRYRPTDAPLVPDVSGKIVIVVDDGVATGATAIACLRQLRDSGASRVIFAVPVGSADSIERLHEEADEVIALATPTDFRAVGRYYSDFGQVSDEEAMTYLNN